MDPRANEWGRSRSKWSLGGGGTHLQQRNWNLRRPWAASQMTASPTRPVSSIFLTLTLLLFFRPTQSLQCSFMDGFSSQADGGHITPQASHTFQAMKSRATGLGQGREVPWCWGRRDLGDSGPLLKPSSPEALPLCHMEANTRAGTPHPGIWRGLDSRSDCEPIVRLG